MAPIPKQLTEKYFPGLGDQHVIGASGLGISAVTATIAVNTSRTDAQVIASAPNTVAVAAGPIVHSLGQPPTFTLIQPVGAPTGLGFGIGYQFITADNSAVYFRAATWTGTAPVGQAVQIIAVP